MESKRIRVTESISLDYLHNEPIIMTNYDIYSRLQNQIINKLMEEFGDPTQFVAVYKMWMEIDNMNPIFKIYTMECTVFYD